MFSYQVLTCFSIFKQKNYVTSSYPMSRVDYVTYNETDFDAFNQIYQYGGTGGIFKFNLTKNFNASSQRWNATMRTLYRSNSEYSNTQRSLPLLFDWYCQ